MMFYKLPVKAGLEFMTSGEGHSLLSQLSWCFSLLLLLFHVNLKTIWSISNKILRGSLIRISLNLYVDQLVEWENFHFLGNVVY